ncbi:unnamed protein product [Symbiodinium sp. CCMP2592]|nr:unnamed protein product [Symbiodinium sp. CCMP2592]
MGCTRTWEWSLARQLRRTPAQVELEEQVNSLKSELEAARGEDLRAALEDLQARHESEVKQAQSAKEELEQALSSKADLEAKIAALQEGVTSPVAADAASESLADERARSEKLQAEVRELTARNDALEAGGWEEVGKEVAGQPSGQEQLVPASARVESAGLAEMRAAREASNAEGERQHSDLREAQSQAADGNEAATKFSQELEQERQQRISEGGVKPDRSRCGFSIPLLCRARDDLDDALEKQMGQSKRPRWARQVGKFAVAEALERMQSAERLATAKSANLEVRSGVKPVLADNFLPFEAARADALAKELEAARCDGADLASPHSATVLCCRLGSHVMLRSRAKQGVPILDGVEAEASMPRAVKSISTVDIASSAKQRVVGGQTFQDVDSFNLRFMDRFMVFHAEATLHASFAMPLGGTVCRMRWALMLCSALAVQAEPAVEVHIVPHTHDDVGWLKTVDEYFTGQNNSIQRAYVRLILDTVVRCLEQNPDRKFTYVETAFFARWWRQQDNSTRQLVRRLVSSGQLEFSNGGWCMHDEAATHFLDMIDQTTLGHKFLMDELSAAPRTGWQLDPFGHSATQAALLSAEVGFQGLFFGRIDYQDLELRREKKEAEFIWRASPSLGSDAQVFTGLTGEYGGNYGPPAGFDWDVTSSDETIQDDPALEDYNVKSRVDDFVAVAMVQANQTRGRHIMMTMGSDFQYEDAYTWFYNLDKLIHHVNADGRVHAFYSTPGMYVDAKKSEKITWPTKEDDFFPYADGPHQFWTGYFTSRPTLKRYIRDTSAFFQVVKQISVISNQPASQMEGLNALAEAMGVAQHHDAASGTAKQHVTFDYAKRLAKGRAAALQGVSAALRQLTQAPASSDFVYCDLRNVSVCAPTQAVGRTTQRSCFTLWNGLGHAREELIELPVSTEKLEVVSGTDTGAVEFQIVESLPSVTNYGAPAGGASKTLLVAVKLPAVGHASYCLQTAGVAAPTAKLANISQGACQALENDNLKLWFCSGMLANITDKLSKTSTRAEQSWMWYNASVGDAASSQASGAYIFRPNRSQAFPVFTGLPFMQVFRGPLADEVHQQVGSWISQRTRLARGAKHVEITYTVSDIPVDDGWGKEIVSRISTDIKTDGTCYTDSNGREMLQRKRDFRPTWKLEQTEEVAGNYFPVTTSMFIRDTAAQLTVLTDVAQAGTGCIRDGEIELMVHRRLLKDDGRGVGEPLNETEFVTPYVGDKNDQGRHYGPGLVTRGLHVVHFGPPATAAATWRPLMDRMYIPVQPFFGGGKATPSVGSFALQGDLPRSLQVLTLSRWDETHILLRIGHQFGIGEDSELSKPVSVDIKKSGQARPDLSSVAARVAWAKERPTGAQRWDLLPHYCQVVQGRRAEHSGRGWLQVTTRLAAEETWTSKGRSDESPRVREHFVVFELPRETSGVAEAHAEEQRKASDLQVRLGMAWLVADLFHQMDTKLELVEVATVVDDMTDHAETTLPWVRQRMEPVAELQVHGVTPTVSRRKTAEDVSRQMFDKRELRKRNKSIYLERLGSWRELQKEVPAGSDSMPSSRVRVYIRKRPLFDHEERLGEFDVVSVKGEQQVVIHNCLTKADLRSLYVSHMGFQFTEAFNEAATNDDIYSRCAAPAVHHVSAGQVATLFLFGQTGSGKSHTMTGLMRRAVQDLFAGSETDSVTCRLTAFEIAGKTMRDLLGHGSSDLKVMEKGNRTHIVGANVCELSSAEKLQQLLEGALARRATRATQANDTSSRSHAVFRICLPGGAVLTLVDCAGSERRQDTTQHDSQGQKESAEINATIFALKECFRAMRAPKGQPPFRSSLLTRVLSDSFSSTDAMIVAIGTVSPSATDTEHSLATVRSLQELQGTKMAFEEQEDIVQRKQVGEAHPRTWTEKDVRHFVQSAASGAARLHAEAVTKGTDGKIFTRWPVQRFTLLCAGDAALGQRLFEELRHRMRAAGA